MGNHSTLDNTKTGFTWLQITECVIFTVIFLISVVGNTLVCLVIFKTPRMRTTRNYLLVNLAVSDLTVALICIPFDVVLKITDPHWPLGTAMCNILWPSMTLVTNCSSLTLAAISLDRYRAVVHPWKSRFSTVQTTAIIVSTWLISFLLVLPYSMALKIRDGYCREDWSHPFAVKIYTMGLFVCHYALPLMVIIFAYVMVAKKLREQAARIERNRATYGSYGVTSSAEKNVNPLQPQTASEVFSSSSPPVKRFSAGIRELKFSDPAQQQFAVPVAANKTEMRKLRRTTNITKMLVTVVVFYAICMLPNQVIWLWYEFGAGGNWSHFNEFHTFGSIMVYINSCVNPLLYAGINEEFRNGFRTLLVCRQRNFLETKV